MRALFYFILLPSSFLLCSCASGPRKTQLHYAPPSTAAIHAPIKSARANAAEAKKAVAAAVSVAKENKIDIPDLSAALDLAGSRIDALTQQLLVADRAIDAYEEQVVKLTNSANKANDERNAAIDARDAAVHRYHSLKLEVCILAAVAVGLLMWQLRAVFLFIPPPYNFALMLAAPIATFGFLWLRL